MKKVIFISAIVLLMLVGLAVYKIRSSQDRGMSADGRMLPPASARNAPEAPKFEASKTTPPATAEKPPVLELPTEFKLPTELDITTPPVPEGISAPAASAQGS
jgi:hypothetical protein